MQKAKFQSLGDLLIELDLLSPEELSRILQEKAEEISLGNYLMEEGLVPEDEFLELLKDQLNLKQVYPEQYSVNENLCKYISEDSARRYNLVPLSQKDNVLQVAMADPTQLKVIEKLEINTGLNIEPLLAGYQEIQYYISKMYSGTNLPHKKIFKRLEEFKVKEAAETENMEELVEKAPVVQLTNLIIERGLDYRATDIHIEPDPRHTKVRYRVDGVLRKGLVIPNYIQSALVSRIKIMADMDITKKREPQDGRIQLERDNRQIDLRISAVPTISGEKIVLRILNRSHSLLDIEELGFTRENLKKYKNMISHPHGILLVTGPTGSGKTTTLFAALKHLKSTVRNIVTVEDPVEYQINGINQIQISSNQRLNFARTLRSILRQDPDIIMVGEIRDQETAEIAVRAALTGHLVLTTLHTNDSASALTRLKNMGIPPYLIASTVVGIIAQRLLRRLCQNCRKEFYPEAETKKFLEGINSQLKQEELLYKAHGCNSCNDCGYKGRIAVQEVMEIDHSLQQMIVEDKEEKKLKKYALSQGMETLKTDGIKKVKQGLTTLEELTRIVL